jgi:hypothetical protein
MEFESNFNVDDEVFFIRGDRINSDIVKGIHMSAERTFDKKIHPRIRYELRDSKNQISESKIRRTAEEVAEMLVEQCKRS